MGRRVPTSTAAPEPPANWGVVPVAASTTTADRGRDREHQLGHHFAASPNEPDRTFWTFQSKIEAKKLAEDRDRETNGVLQHPPVRGGLRGQP